MGIVHWDPEKKCVMSGPAPRRGSQPATARGSSGGGISFQFPPGWDDGSGKVQHVKSGPFKGRVIFSNSHEAREVAKRYEGKSGERTRYNPT